MCPPAAEILQRGYKLLSWKQFYRQTCSFSLLRLKFAEHDTVEEASVSYVRRSELQAVQDHRKEDRKEDRNWRLCV